MIRSTISKNTLRSFSTSVNPVQAENPVPKAASSFVQSILHGSESARNEGKTEQHSKLLGKGTLIHEMQKHRVVPSKVNEYKSAAEEYYSALEASGLGVKLIGNFETVIGDEDTFIHLLQYESYSGYDAYRSSATTNTSLLSLRSTLASTLHQRNNLLMSEFRFWPELTEEQAAKLRSDSGGFYELRSYDLIPGSMLEWEGAWRRGIEARRRFVNPAGAYFSQVGPLHQVHHLWQFPDLNTRKQTRERAWEVSGWSDTVKRLLLLVLLIAYTTILLVVAATSTSPTVIIKNGTLFGASLPTFNQEIFLGIPYAQTTGGQNRLRPPVSLNNTFNREFNATFWGHNCPGFGGDDLSSNLPNNETYSPSEDCLSINIIRPAGLTNTSALPIMFWIHGGGFDEGGARDPRYNGSYLVRRSVEQSQPIIFVSINYRKGAYGFPAGQEALLTGNLNLGLRDQRLALHWTQENIKSFGGDPSKVTIVGESAGGESIIAQMAAYGGRDDGLFRGVIIESGVFPYLNVTLSSQQPSWDSFLNSTGCLNVTSELSCLRALSFDAFNTSAAAYSPNPVPDNDFVKGVVWNEFDQEAYLNVPLIVGNNRDEGTAFGGRGSNNNTALRKAMANSFSLLHPSNKTVDKWLQLYPDIPYAGLGGCPFDTGDGVPTSGLLDKRSFTLAADGLVAGSRHTAALNTIKGSDSWVYSFDQVPQNISIETGATHFQEVPYVFGVTEQTIQNPFSLRPGDLGTSEIIQTYWINFVNNLNPNNGHMPSIYWPVYDNSAPKAIRFINNNTHVVDDTYRNVSVSFIQSLASGYSG